MARGGINKALVHKARQALLARGENPSIDAVRVEMGNTGSKTTIHRYLKELEGHESPAPSINEELAELVANLAERLQGQAQERIDEAEQHAHQQCQTLRTELAGVQQQLEEWQTRFSLQKEVLTKETLALEQAKQALQQTHTENTRLNQANHDLQSRLEDRDRHIESLEEKHRHARDALEHYRTSVKEQRDQEQQRHEGQIQQLQMELRQARQTLALHQESITLLNRDNERLLAEQRGTARELHTCQTQLEKASKQIEKANAEQHKAINRSAQLEVRLQAAQQEGAAFKQSLGEATQQNRMLEILLSRKEATLETLQAQIAEHDSPAP